MRPRRNIELKARDPDPARSLEACSALGAIDQGTLWQRDSYFDVHAGALKLREQDPGQTQLIQYERATQARARESRYRTIAIADPETLLAALTAAIGVTVVVTKRRRLFMWNGVRIHLDEVEQLGSFVEIEAVAEPGSDLSREHELVAHLREALSIGEEQILATGYAAQLRDLSPDLGKPGTDNH